jgi:hypothetical protein
MDTRQDTMTRASLREVFGLDYPGSAPGSAGIGFWDREVTSILPGMHKLTYHAGKLQDGSPAIELMPDTKIKAEGGLAEGTLYLPKSGHLEVVFDNSYSILRYILSKNCCQINPARRTLSAGFLLARKFCFLQMCERLHQTGFCDSVETQALVPWVTPWRSL